MTPLQHRLLTTVAYSTANLLDEARHFVAAETIRNAARTLDVVTQAQEQPTADQEHQARPDSGRRNGHIPVDHHMAVLIGGTRDGEVFSADPRLTRLTRETMDGRAAETYINIALKGPKGQSAFRIFVLEGLDPADAISRVVERMLTGAPA